ncbi:hypothetical protein [Veillonella sp. 3310]|uniref:hypothetical protein n=1 Tax=Veillonella sp. 3310 TaxID=2490956 RepID=UPI000FD65779|nr:hypothetical protein [Veillonella sp. 3310]
MKEDKFWKYALYISLAGHIALIPVASAIFNKVTEPFHESTTTFYEVSMAESAQEQASENSQSAEQQPPQEESTPSEPQEAVAVPEIPESMKPEPRPEQPKQEVPKQKPSTLPKQQPITSPQSNAALQAAEAAARAKAEADAAARAQEQEARTTVVNSPYPLADPKPTNPTPGQTGTVYVTARIYESGQVADVEVSGDANSAQQNAVAAYVPTIPFAPGTNKFGDPLPSVVRFSVVFR